MLDKLIGNDPIKDRLRQLLKTGRVPHSFIFAGIDGIGKKRFAFELAKAFLCSDLRGLEACDKCAACLNSVKFTFPKPDARDDHKKVIFSAHPDLGMVVPYKRNVLVDAIRDLEREANFRPFQATARFFIIDPADMMTPSAANALLKTLEEPPDSSYIFLVTSRPDTLLQTIQSRCQVVRFTPVERTKIEEYLLSTGKFSPADAGLLAQISGGSIGGALETNPDHFREDRAKMLRVLESLVNRKNRAILLRTAEEISDAKYKDEYERRLANLQVLVHDVWSLTLGKTAAELANSDIASDLTRLAGQANAQKLASWLSEIEILRENLNVNLNRKIATDALFMTMANG